jgi:hypothetical protein
MLSLKDSEKSSDSGCKDVAGSLKITDGKGQEHGGDNVLKRTLLLERDVEKIVKDTKTEKSVEEGRVVSEGMGLDSTAQGSTKIKRGAGVGEAGGEGAVEGGVTSNLSSLGKKENMGCGPAVVEETKEAMMVDPKEKFKKFKKIGRSGKIEEKKGEKVLVGTKRKENEMDIEEEAKKKKARDTDVEMYHIQNAEAGLSE